jgi:hypothetical protein
LTALTAAGPDELIIAVLTKLKLTRKNWSTITGNTSDVIKENSISSPVKRFFMR